MYIYMSGVDMTNLGSDKDENCTTFNIKIDNFLPNEPITAAQKKRLELALLTEVENIQKEVDLQRDIARQRLKTNCLETIHNLRLNILSALICIIFIWLIFLTCYVAVK